MNVFADVGPGRPRGGLWAVEIGQDVFQVFFISSLAQDLFDDAGGDGYSTLGSVFILPERQNGGRNKVSRGYDVLPSVQPVDEITVFSYSHHEHSSRAESAFVFDFFFLNLPEMW